MNRAYAISYFEIRVPSFSCLTPRTRSHGMLLPSHFFREPVGIEVPTLAIGFTELMAIRLSRSNPSRRAPGDNLSELSLGLFSHFQSPGLSAPVPARGAAR